MNVTHWRHTALCCNLSNYANRGRLKTKLCVIVRRCYGKGPQAQGSTSSHSNPFRRYISSLKWVPIPLGVGFAYICYQQYGHVVEREEKKLKRTKDPEELVAKDWQVQFITTLPWNIMSRAWGRLNNLYLPVWMRKSFYGSYIWAFDCKLEEAAVRDLQHYENLGKFFRRRLRPGCRPVDDHHCMVSPSDGKVLHFGKMENGKVEQVKGVTYSVKDFLGPLNWPTEGGKAATDSETETVMATDSTYGQCLTQCSDNTLYHCVIYLAPGDYHGFHSPTDWKLNFRRHFPGELLSVNPAVTRWVQGLFNLNERAVYIGSWQHGFFAMAAVGATIVGSIKVYMDENLDTNSPKKSAAGCHLDCRFDDNVKPGVAIRKGEAFGEFNLGSTIVLLFEAPDNFEFKVESGQKIKYGQPIGHCETTTSSDRQQG